MSEYLQLFELESEEELRIEFDGSSSKEDASSIVELELTKGQAEIFGTELLTNVKYAFTTNVRASFAVFTFHGCQIKIRGRLAIQPYTSKETPMLLYLNVHAGLETLRKEALVDTNKDSQEEDKKRKNDEDEDNKTKKRGPVVLVVGPSDVGKSTLCRLLANYAVRMGRRPVLVDLDVRRSSLPVPPATMSARLLERVLPIEEMDAASASSSSLGSLNQNYIVYHYGHLSPGTNTALYNCLVSRLADVVREKMSNDDEVRGSGVIINTGGWIRGEGYEQIKHAAQAFEVDVILVLEQERLYNDLVRDLPSFVKVIWLPKSGGVVEHEPEMEGERHAKAIRKYFYGLNNQFFPHSFEVRVGELRDRIFQIGAPSLPASCLPLGVKSEDNRLKLLAVSPSSKSLNHRILAISYANNQDEAVVSNVAGFVCVMASDKDRITVLSPQPKPLPSKGMLLLSDALYVDAAT